MKSPPQQLLEDQKRTQAHATEGIREVFLEEEEEKKEEEEDEGLNRDPWR